MSALRTLTRGDTGLVLNARLLVLQMACESAREAIAAHAVGDLDSGTLAEALGQWQLCVRDAQAAARPLHGSVLRAEIARVMEVDQ